MSLIDRVVRLRLPEMYATKTWIAPPRFQHPTAGRSISAKSCGVLSGSTLFRQPASICSGEDYCTAGRQGFCKNLSSL